MELDGFVRSFELLDDLEIVSIRYPKSAPGKIDEIYSRAVDQISLELHFAMALSTDATYDLVMEQVRKFQRVGIDVEIEQVDDLARIAE